MKSDCWFPEITELPLFDPGCQRVFGVPRGPSGDSGWLCEQYNCDHSLAGPPDWSLHLRGSRSSDNMSTQVPHQWVIGSTFWNPSHTYTLFCTCSDSVIFPALELIKGHIFNSRLLIQNIHFGLDQVIYSKLIMNSSNYFHHQVIHHLFPRILRRCNFILEVK